MCAFPSDATAPSRQGGLPLMPNATNADIIDASVASAHQVEIIEDRRRPGRIHNVSPALIPILRNPTAGAVTQSD